MGAAWWGVCLAGRGCLLCFQQHPGTQRRDKPKPAFVSTFCSSHREHMKALTAGSHPGFSPALQQQVVCGDTESTTCSRSQLWERSKLCPPERRDWEGSGCSDKYSHLGIFSSRSRAGKTPHCPCSEPDLFNYSECNAKWL